MNLDLLKIGEAKGKAKKLKSIIETGEIADDRENKLKEYVERMKEDIKNLGYFARKTYYKILHSYFSDLQNDTLQEDSLVFLVGVRLDSALSSIILSRK